MISDRVRGVPLNSQSAAQPISERGERPTHHDPSPCAVLRIHDCLLSIDGPLDQTRETADALAQCRPPTTKHRSSPGHTGPDAA